MILNTQQIILLCLLVSFVTSIATGITTVSLMQQAPEPVSQTINRVIEKTVESVTQQPVSEIREIINPGPGKEVTTVVVNQEDQSINAVSKNELSVARLFTGSDADVYAAMGIVVNSSGDIVADKRTVDKRTTYSARYGSRTYPVKYVSGTETADFVTLRIEGDNPQDFTAASLADSKNLKLAQSVISLTGATDTSASTGSVVSLPLGADGAPALIKTSVDPQNVLTGSVLLNLRGDIVGIRTAAPEDKTVFMPINLFKAQIAPPQP